MINSLPGSSKRLLLLIACCLTLVDVFACQCEGVNTVKDNYDKALIVFTGKVIKIEYVGVAETMNPDSIAVARSIMTDMPRNTLDQPMVLKAHIVVTNEFKGIKKNDTIIVYTGIRGASCGYKFEQNKEYTIYAAKESYMHLFLRVNRKRFNNFDKAGVYWTSICTRTTVSVGQEEGMIREYLNKSVR